MLNLLKNLAGHDGDVQALDATLNNLDNELATATRSLADAEASYGDRLLDSTAAGDYAKLEADLDAKRRNVGRIGAARHAVQIKLYNARERDAALSLEVRWKEHSDALDARGRALVRVEKCVADMADAIGAAQQAADAAYDTFPPRSDGNHSAFGRHFANVAEMVHPYLDAALSPNGSLAYSLKERGSLVDQHNDGAEYWRSQRDTPVSASLTTT